MHVKIIDAAELELHDGFEYYENQTNGLGKNLINDFRQSLERILNYPEAFTQVQNNIRKCRLKKFPYSIIYALEENLIIILAIAHHHRNPEYWISRHF
jgi:plasmid stabilization system protein ParE